MQCLNEIFPIILYFLGSILLIVLIIFVIKLMGTIKKVNKVVDDIDTKSKQLNGVFNIIDTTADTLSSISDKVVNFIVNGLISLFTKKKNRKEEDEDE